MNFDVICFDCDSTLSRIEGIDELARRAGMFDAMAKLTEAAMNGEVPLEAVYEKRLSLIRPDQDSINWLADCYVADVVEGAKELCAELMALGKQVHIVSGGIKSAIMPLANYLGLPEENVHAVEIYFNEDGSYRSYDMSSPLARNGGKAEVVGLLKAEGSIVMIGDGKTDMEAKDAGAYVIGFGGVADRPVVRQMADFYTVEPSLLVLLPHIS
jgi:phosphoserine phosphatase